MKTPKYYYKYLVPIFLVFPIMTCCGFVEDIKELIREMNTSATEVKAEIETEIGGEVKVGWEIETDTTTVNVTFTKLPAGSVNVEELKQKVTAIVKKHFHREIQVINIAF